jgi:HlyD family secretion protein
MNYVMDTPLALPWWRKRLWVQGGIALGLAVLGAIALRVFMGAAERTVRIPLGNVTVATVTRSAFHDYVALRATVVPLDTIYLDASEGGRVERILVQAGDLVEKGQTLVELSNTELELDVLEREGRLIESITQLQSYQTQLEQNRIANSKALEQIDYDIIRLRRSLGRRTRLAGIEPVEVREGIQDELEHDLKLQPMQAASNRKQEELRAQQLPQIQSQLQKLQEDLKITHGKLDNLTVRAPATGRVTSMDLKVGQSRNRGERFAEITPDTGDKLAAAVDEYYLQQVHAGQIATVEIADRSYSLKVTRVYPQVKDGMFTVDLAFVEAVPKGLLPGQTVQGRLSLGADTLTLTMPSGAFLERTGGDWIFVLDPDGRVAHRRTTKLGRRNADQVEILGGLSAGEKVLTSDYSGLERIDRVELER